MVDWKEFIGDESGPSGDHRQVCIRPGLATAHGADDNAVRMGREIERKFLVRSAGWRQEATSTRPLRQGYLAIDDGNNVRVRTDGQSAWLTIKGRGEGITRPEFEYEIPVDDAAALFALCRGRLVDKTRHLVPVGALSWEIDEFSGDNAGLVVAEIELPDENTAVPQPAWLGDEVTADPRYLNANLAVHPFARWER
jgi:adenylate cyclase